jgi:hypothetical protein
MKNTILTLAVSLGLAVASFGGNTSTVFSAPSRVADDLFGPEWQVGLAGTYQEENGADYGAGFGVTRFISENLGFGLEGSYIGEKGAWDYSAAANVLYRYPIENLRLAPYALAGVGAMFDDIDSGDLFYQVGGGVEYRVTDRIGLFTQIVYQFVTDGQDYPAAQAGVKITF